jgi:hypothetical protein
MHSHLNALVGLAMLCVGIAGCDQKTTAPPAQARPPGPTPEQVAKAKYEMDEKCAADTRVWFKANYPEEPEPMKVQGGGEIVNTMPTYQNHYSHKRNGCFALLENMTTFPRPHAQVVQTDSIWDVNENRRIGVLVQKDLQKVTACNTDGHECSSKSEFEDMAREYLAE